MNCRIIKQVRERLRAIRNNLKNKIIVLLLRYLQKKQRKKPFQQTTVPTGSDILSLEKFRYFVENINDVIMEAYFDERGCTYVSPKVYDHIGYTPEELMGKTPYDFISEKDAVKLFDEFMRVFKTGKGTKNFQVTLIHKKGYPVITEVSTELIYNPDGDIIGFYGITRDVTERKKEKDLSDALNDINAAINSTLEIEEILQRVVDKAYEAMECESCFIGLSEGGDWEIKYAAGTQQELIGTVLTNNDIMKTFSAAVRSNSPLVIKNAEHSEIVDDKIKEKFNLKSLLIAPFKVKEEIIGGISFNFHSKLATFNEARVDFANKLASAISLAIENSQLFKFQKQISDTLQKSFLSVPDAIDGLEFGHTYHSATVTAQVGGDFYDLFELKNNKIGIVIGDVSGRGLQAANMTAMVKNTIKAFAYYDDYPCSVLSKTNELIKGSTPVDMFVTVFFAVLDKESGELIYSNAGHPPAMVIRKKSLVSLDNQSIAIGLFDNISYFDKTEELGIGETLLIHTDGVLETRRGKDFYGSERLIKLLNKRKHRKASELPQIIMDEIEDFSGGKLFDDVAILAVSRV